MKLVRRNKSLVGTPRNMVRKTFTRKLVMTRGETMIEVVLSLAVFALTMTMITVMLGTASRVYVKNYKQETQFEKQVNALNNDVTDDVTIQEQKMEFEYELKKVDGLGEQDVKFQIPIEVVKAKDDSENKLYLEKFRVK